MSNPIRSQKVLAVRGVVLWAIRAISAFLMVYGAFLVLARGIFGLLHGWRQMTAYMGVGQDHGLVRGIPMILAGVAIALLSKKIARWIVAVPESGCVRCAYPGLGQPGICPECGYNDSETSTEAD